MPVAPEEPEDLDALLADSSGRAPERLASRRFSSRIVVAGSLAGAAAAALCIASRTSTGSGFRSRADSSTVLQEVACAGDGEDCGQSLCCADSSLTCFKKNDFWSACLSSCDKATVDELDGQPWACDILSQAGIAPEAEAAAPSPPPQPACHDVMDTKCLKANCSIADGGPQGDCRETMCCSMPGTQCFKQNDYWASCKQSCDPNAETELLGKGWSCEALGPRTPGDPHAWRPCPRAADAPKPPLLVDGDVPAAWLHAEDRAKRLVDGLTLLDKVALLRGQNDPYPNDRHGYAGYINPNYYFNNPCAMPLMLNDGPQGYNHYQTALKGTTTQFPALLTVAASFDPEASRRYARAVAKEFAAKGSNVMLGPDVEVGRNPLSGRAFETLSGEDPFLGSALVKPFVEETLKRGIIVTVKHWLDNNEEDFRMTMSVSVGERAQHELYMPVFKAAFEAGAGAVMCSYQKVAGAWACENAHILKKLLRDELGFRGFVMSDWGATHDAVRSANSGLDMEMPGGADDKFHELPDLVKAGKVKESTIDEMATHVLSSMYAAGLMDGQFRWSSGEADLDSNVTSDEHRDVALRSIVEGAVLLKNEGGALPLSPEVKKIAMVGRYCKDVLDKSFGQGDVFSGGGSGWVMSNMQVSPLTGVREHFRHAKVSFAKTVADAADADVAIVCAAAHAEEGWDRPNLTLPEAEHFVTGLRSQSLAQKIVVLAIAPGVITTEWLSSADAALVLFMPGEQVGRAVARLLSGDASPGGRLPVSLPHRAEHRFTPEQYPGVPFNDINMTSHWSEGTLVGYRWNDAKQVPSAFPFGFGLSYTTFDFTGFQASCSPSAATISVTVMNTGSRFGHAVPQLYVSFPSLLPVVRQLRGFKKLGLHAGDQGVASFELTTPDWSYYDTMMGRWQSAMGKGEAITVSIGTSSTDLLWTQILPCSAMI